MANAAITNTTTTDMTLTAATILVLSGGTIGPSVVLCGTSAGSVCWLGIKSCPSAWEFEIVPLVSMGSGNVVFGALVAMGSGNVAFGALVAMGSGNVAFGALVAMVSGNVAFGAWVGDDVVFIALLDV